MTVRRNIESPLLVRRYHADGPDREARKLTRPSATSGSTRPPACSGWAS